MYLYVLIYTLLLNKKKEIQSLFSMLQMFNNTILNPRIVLKIKLCKKQADKNIFHLDPFWMNLLKLPCTQEVVGT